MLNMPKHRVCLSVKTRGYWKPVRVFMPRPSVYSTQWEFQSTWAQRGLGFWAVSAIDLLYPWTRRWAKSESDTPVHWWDNETYKGESLPKWLAKYWTYLDQKQPSYVMSDEAAEGPMVQKTIQDSLNILLTYKSFWQWGGEWAQPVAACNPKGTTPGYQQPIAHPGSFTDPRDYDRFGIIKDIALKRVTQPGPEGNSRAFSGFLSSSEAESSEETEDEPRSKRVRFEDEYSEETEEETEDPRPPLVRHRRQHRRRTSVEQLR
nr:ORF1 [Bat anellovirus BtSY1]